MAELLPDVHRELRRVTVLGDVVAVELSIQGTFLGPFETPAGIVQPTGVKIDEFEVSAQIVARRWRRAVIGNRGCSGRLKPWPRPSIRLVLSPST